MNPQQTKETEAMAAIGRKLQELTGVTDPAALMAQLSDNGDVVAEVFRQASQGKGAPSATPAEKHTGMSRNDPRLAARVREMSKNPRNVAFSKTLAAAIERVTGLSTHEQIERLDEGRARAFFAAAREKQGDEEAIQKAALALSKVRNSRGQLLLSYEEAEEQARREYAIQKAKRQQKRGAR